MNKFEFTVPHHGRGTHGFACFPDGAEGKKYPLVIMSHGYNGYETDFEGSAEYFAAHGIAAASITFCGGSTRDKSGFATTSMTIDTECEDVVAVADMLMARDDVDNEHVYLFGASMGGLVSVLSAQRCPGRFCGLLLLFPALCIPDNWNERFPNAEDIPETLEFWGMELGRDFFLSLRTLDVDGALSGFDGGILLMHGDRDPIVPISYGKHAKEVGRRVSLETFIGEGHGFSMPATLRMEGMMKLYIDMDMDTIA